LVIGRLIELFKVKELGLVEALGSNKELNRAVETFIVPPPSRPRRPMPCSLPQGSDEPSCDRAGELKWFFSSSVKKFSMSFSAAIPQLLGLGVAKYPSPGAADDLALGVLIFTFSGVWRAAEHRPSPCPLWPCR